jgi:hypothetical protein
MSFEDVQAEAVPDGRVPVWEKLVYLATFAAFTGAARKPAGAIWDDDIGRAAFLGCQEVEAVARAEVCRSSPTSSRDDRLSRRVAAGHAIVAVDRSAAGQADRGRGSAGRGGRRGRALGVPTPGMTAFTPLARPRPAGLDVVGGDVGADAARAVNTPTTRIRRGAHAATRSSRIWLVADS